jgi:hypothetical protein
MRTRLPIAVVLALSVLAMGGLQAQLARPPNPSGAPSAPRTENVTVDTAQGYARILFTFAQPVSVASAIADGVLTIRLGQPVNTNVDAFVEALGRYVSSARRDPDGLTYRFALNLPVTLHNSTEGNRSVVDLVPGSFKGTPPDLAPPPAPRAAQKEELPDPSKLPVIRMAVGEYSNYTRLIFDWPAVVNYDASPVQGGVSVRFAAPAQADLSALQRRLPPWVKGVTSRRDGATTIVDIQTDAESSFHDSRDGTKILIDVLAPRTDASTIAPAVASSIEPRARPAAPIPNPPPKGSDAAAALKPHPPSSTAPVAAIEPVPAVGKPSAELTRDGAALHFPESRGRTSAVFTRGETLWIVLEGHPIVEPATLLAPLSGLLQKAEADQSSGAAVLKLVFKKPLLASVQESQSALDVNLAGGVSTPPDPIGFTRQGAEGEATLTTSLPGAAHVLELADPEAADHLFVVPARPGKGVVTPKRFVEMEALPSAVGLAIVPSADDLSVQVQNEMVTLSRPRGLAVSAASGATSEPIVQMLTSKLGPAFIDFAQWRNLGSGNVFEAERKMRSAIARGPESQSNGARLRLARYLLAQQLAPEALGEIQLIQGADPKLEGDPGLLAMKGAAQYMMGRYADARASLSTGALAGDAHAALWRGMAEGRLADLANARHDLALAQTVLRFYPNDWQVQARLVRAETGLAQGDLTSANDALDQLGPDLTPRQSVEARLYGAQLLAAQGHVNEALSRLRTLAGTDYPPVAAKATYARVETEIAAKKTTAAEAIKTLDQLRYRWRGDDLELKTLRKLGSLYFSQNNWREGLGVLRVAAVNFPRAELARIAQDDMRRAFTDLFLGGKADAMRPVEALALFYDFIELTPVGRDGDEMIRHLSDRLVAVDLLAPAEQLLDHQVRERLDGVARASVATKLAVIYLLDHKPKEALAIINDTRQTLLPEELNEQRHLLEARALAGLKQFDSAVDLIAADDSPEAKRLRADIYWEAANWSAAGEQSEELLAERWQTNQPLTAEERGHVMRAAVAYSLAGSEPALARLRQHYAAKMTASPDAKAFAVVTERIENQGVAFRDLAKQIASVDSLQAFMAEFKTQGAAKLANK